MNLSTVFVDNLSKKSSLATSVTIRYPSHLTISKTRTQYILCIANVYTLYAMGKKKKKSDKDENVKLVVRIEAGLRDAFIETCQEMDTTASREVRQFIRDFLARLGKSDISSMDDDNEL